MGYFIGDYFVDGEVAGMAGMKSLPRSRAKTAWGLCSNVIKVIQAEPKRANMRRYVHDQPPEQGGPACGTVGCFGGWISLLGSPSRYKLISPQVILGDVVHYAIVGPEKEHVFNSGDGDACASTTPGTVAHMRAVVRRIKKFMKVNEKALKARKLSDVRK